MDIVLLSTTEKELAVSGQDIVRLFYPEANLHLQPLTGASMVLTLAADFDGRDLIGKAELSTGVRFLAEKVKIDGQDDSWDDRTHRKRLVRLALYRLLLRYTDTKPRPWGILTGIRPTKIVHRLMDMDWEVKAILNYLAASYDMDQSKAGLLTEIALLQRKYLASPEQAEKLVSVYIGIPFCPTRCAYCSFPAYPVGTKGGLVEPFLEGLRKEIKGVGQALADHGMRVQTIYIGGGTPTVLNSAQLDSLLKEVRDSLVSRQTAELTLEAGRPDTISADKLSVAAEFGVTRLSINPQSMNEHTLRKIGRRHTPGMVRESIDLARKMGFQNINMDVIVGLPGETIADVNMTLGEIKEIGPENLTVHTLAVKRASHLKEAKDQFVMAPPEQVAEMLRLTAEAAEEMGMHPYYLYRQKMMVSPLENIGYAQEGFDCIYNVQMIEERQTIIGLGCGASSKFVEPATWYLTSHYNPKDPETYIRRVQDIISRKVDKLGSFG